MEQWDIYDENKQKTGRTMNRNDWHMKPDEFHLTVLGVLQRPDGKYLITRRNLDKEWAAGWWEVPGGGVRAAPLRTLLLLHKFGEAVLGIGSPFLIHHMIVRDAGILRRIPQVLL